MLPDGMYTGVVDRFEEDAEGRELAVVLLEEGDQVIEQVDLLRSTLPTGIGQDAVLAVDIVDGDVANAEYLPQETETRGHTAQDRFDRLAQRPPDGQEDESNSGADG